MFAGSGRSRGRVLVIDDEPALRLLCNVNLTLAGFIVDEAESGREGVARAHEHRPDLILLDMMLPEFDGHAVVHALRADPAFADIPVVFLSARTAPEDIRDAYREGAVDYITKPFDPVDLAERVGDVLERVRAGGADEFRHAQLARLGLL